MNYSRVVMRWEVRSPDGVLRVAVGAKGTVVSSNQGVIGVRFDEGQDAYVEPDGSGRLIRDVPFLNTDYEDMHLDPVTAAFRHGHFDANHWDGKSRNPHVDRSKSRTPYVGFEDQAAAYDKGYEEGVRCLNSQALLTG